MDDAQAWLKWIFGPIIAGAIWVFTRGSFRQAAQDKIEKRKGEAELDILDRYKRERDEERARCADLDKQLHAMATSKYEAEAEAAVLRRRLEASELATEAANRRTAAADEAVQIIRGQCVAAEMTARRLALRLREVGIEPPGDGDPP